MKTNLMKDLVLSHRERYLKESDRLLQKIDEGKLPSNKGPAVDPLTNTSRSLLCKTCMEETPNRFTRCTNRELDMLLLISTRAKKFCCDENEEETAVNQEQGCAYVEGRATVLRNDEGTYRNLSWKTKIT